MSRGRAIFRLTDALVELSGLSDDLVELSKRSASQTERPRWLSVLEVGLVFAVFFLQGATPVPDVNEPYYVGKAIHYWNPDWIPGDFFLESGDAHVTFYFLTGWLGRWFEPAVIAWLGRLVTWGLLAWAWCRASRALMPGLWFGVLSAALFAIFQQHGRMAGEWMIGGFEAKGLAYVLVLLGLAAMLRDHWASAWVFFGMAAALHVLAGGWAAVACLLAWLVEGRRRVGLRMVWPGMLIGALLSLPGVVPALALDWGVASPLRAQAHQIYVFHRLAHHLLPRAFAPGATMWFGVLVIVWFVLRTVHTEPKPWKFSHSASLRISEALSCFSSEQREAWQRLRAFVNASLAILTVGLALSLLEWVSPAWAAWWLRFYWFRLADVMLPLGVAFGLGLGVLKLRRSTVWFAARTTLSEPFVEEPGVRRSHPKAAEGIQTPSSLHLIGVLSAWGLYLLLLLWAVVHFGGRAISLLTPHPPPAYRLSDKSEDFIAWREACRWINHSGRIPAEACFITPRMNQTFKWYARRAEVVNYKEVPQDAASLVEWWQRLSAIHATGKPASANPWYKSLEQLDARRLRSLGRRYGAGYVIARRRRSGPHPDLPVVYRNRRYVIYRLD